MERFTRITSVAGMSVLGLGVGLAVSACGPNTPSAAAAASSAAASAPAASAPLVASPTATSAASAPAAAATGSSALAATPVASAAAASSAPAGTAQTAAPPPAANFVVWDCAGKSQVKPANFVLTCADAGLRWTAVHWAKWASGGAAGTGALYMNDCTPNCASGKFMSYPADLSLTGSSRSALNDLTAYTKVTFTFTTSARPTVNGGQPATWTLALPPAPSH